MINHPPDDQYLHRLFLSHGIWKVFQYVKINFPTMTVIQVLVH